MPLENSKEIPERIPIIDDQGFTTDDYFYYREFMTDREIWEDLLFCSPVSFYNWKKIKNIKSSDVFRRKIMKRLEKGMCAAEIADELNVHPTTVYKKIRKDKSLKELHEKTKSKTKRPSGKITNSAIERYLKENWNLSEIAKNESVAISTVSRRINKDTKLLKLYKGENEQT